MPAMMAKAVSLSLLPLASPHCPPAVAYPAGLSATRMAI